MARNRGVVCECLRITGVFLVFKSCCFFALSDRTLAKSLGIPLVACVGVREFTECQLTYCLIRQLDKH